MHGVWSSTSPDKQEEHTVLDRRMKTRPKLWPFTARTFYRLCVRLEPGLTCDLEDRLGAVERERRKDRIRSLHWRLHSYKTLPDRHTVSRLTGMSVSCLMGEWSSITELMLMNSAGRPELQDWWIARSTAHPNTPKLVSSCQSNNNKPNWTIPEHSAV